jgi:methylated-DNA-[protein]-cysteine S-methyltransferase
MKPTSLRSTIYIGNLAESPLGPIWIAVSDQGLVAVYIGTNRDTFAQSVEKMGFSDFAIDPERTASVLEQISEYLEGERQIFDMPIDWSVMTPFQQQALRATLAIPYGQVTAYGDLARRLGKPRAARAVGRAQATNPMPIVIPCHRVIGADGGLHGYGAGDGLKTKAWLLRLEGASLG